MFNLHFLTPEADINCTQRKVKADHSFGCQSPNWSYHHLYPLKDMFTSYTPLSPLKMCLLPEKIWKRMGVLGATAPIAWMVPTNEPYKVNTMHCI